MKNGRFGVMVERLVNSQTSTDLCVGLPLDITRRRAIRRPVAARAALHRRSRRANPADLPVAAARRHRIRYRVAPGDTLTGLGVSPGSAKGRARVAFDLSEVSELEPGEIIVCSTMDPSWVPLFMIAGGVVCDIVAPASHAAIVSRELGVPCVVSVRDASRRIPNGSLIEIDGRSGTVSVFEV